IRCPCSSFVSVTIGAGVRDLIYLRHCRRDESECVAANVDIRNRLLNFRHVAVYTLGARACCGMMRVGLDGWSMRSVLRVRPVAGETDLRGGSPEVCIVFRAVHIMATETSNSAPVHQAL